MNAKRARNEKSALAPFSSRQSSGAGPSPLVFGKPQARDSGRQVILPEHKWGEKTLVPQPSIESKETNPPTPIVIQLKDVGESQRPLLKINQEEVAWDELESRLTAAFKLRVDRVAFVKGDPEVEFEYVAQAVDITHHAGADRIGLMEKKISRD